MKHLKTIKLANNVFILIGLFSTFKCNAITIEFSKLECIPQLQHYYFAHPIFVDSQYIDTTDIKLLKKLWDSYTIVESTGPGFSEYPEDYDQSVVFEDIEFFEHTCAIGLGIRTRIKRQEWRKSHCTGLMRERIQLFYNNIFILDVNNSVSCDNLFEFEGPKDNLGISYITYKDENIVIGVGIKKPHLYEYNEQIPNDECAFYNAEFIYPIEISDNPLEASLEKSVALLPLTEEKIKNIVKQKINSEEQMHLNTDMKNIAKKCSFEILINQR